MERMNQVRKKVTKLKGRRIENGSESPGLVVSYPSNHYSFEVAKITVFENGDIILEGKKPSEFCVIGLQGNGDWK
jgi:hypothetical protein